MDAWLCESMREVDNVVICLDPKMGWGQEKTYSEYCLLEKISVSNWKLG